MTARGRTQFAPTISCQPRIELVGWTFAYGKISRNVLDRPYFLRDDVGIVPYDVILNVCVGGDDLGAPLWFAQILRDDVI